MANDTPDVQAIRHTLMTGLAHNAAIAALERLALTSPVAPEQVVAASAFQKALDIRIEQGWQLGGNACPVLYTDTINGQQVCRDDLWLATTAGLKGASPEAAPAAMEGDYPPLPKPWDLQHDDNGRPQVLYTSVDMRAYVDADRALRPAATPAAPSAGVVDSDPTTKEQYRRMFNAACAALASINEALGLDPDDGGAEPILDAVRELQACQSMPELATAAREILSRADDGDSPTYLQPHEAQKLRAALAQPAPVQAGAQQAVAVTGEMIAAGMKAANVLDPVLATLYPNELTAVYQAMHAVRPFAHATECTTCGALVVGVAEPFDAEEARKRGIDYFADRYPALKEALAAPTQAGAGDATHTPSFKTCRMDDGRCGICGGDWSVCGCEGMLRRAALKGASPSEGDA